jgi:hypothetical protein
MSPSFSNEIGLINEIRYPGGAVDGCGRVDQILHDRSNSHVSYADRCTSFVPGSLLLYRLINLPKVLFGSRESVAKVSREPSCLSPASLTIVSIANCQLLLFLRHSRSNQASSMDYSPRIANDLPESSKQVISCRATQRRLT